jgi:multiple sugar transport system substrate-binding protein
MFTKSKGPRVIAAITTTAALTLGLGACSSGGGDASADGTVTLDYILWEDTQLEGYEASIAEFEKQNPTIQVNLRQEPWTDYWTKLLTQLAGGTAPDVFTNHLTYFPEFVDKGSILDLSDYIEEDELDMSIYYPQLVEAWQSEGAQYGLPKDWDTIGMFYNKDLLAEAGFTEFPTDLTWAPDGSGTLIPFLQKLTIDANGVTADQPDFDETNIVQYGMSAYPNFQPFAANYVAANGGTYQESPGSEPVVDSPQNVETYEFISDLMYEYHVSPPGDTVVDPNTGAEGDQFGAGKIAILQNGSWTLNYLNSVSDFEIGVGLLPTGPEGRVSVFNGLTDAISVTSEHPDEAWELVKWLGSAESQTIVGSAGASWPAIESVTETYADAWAEEGVDVSAFLELSRGDTVASPSGVGWGPVQTAIDQAVNGIYLNSSTPADALRKAQADAEEAYEESQ